MTLSISAAQQLDKLKYRYFPAAYVSCFGKSTVKPFQV